MFRAPFKTAPSASPLSAVADPLIPSSPGLRHSARLQQLGSSAMCALVLSLRSLLPSSGTLEALDPVGPSVNPVFCVSALSSTTYQPHFDPLPLVSFTTDVTASCFFVPALNPVLTDFVSACRDPVYGAEWEKASSQ